MLTLRKNYIKDVDDYKEKNKTEKKASMKKKKLLQEVASKKLHKKHEKSESPEFEKKEDQKENEKKAMHTDGPVNYEAFRTYLDRHHGIQRVDQGFNNAKYLADIMSGNR